MYFIDDFIDFFFDAIAFILKAVAIIFPIVVLTVVIMYATGYFENSSDDPVLTKIESCEARVKEMIGGSPQFERGTEEIKDNVYIITGTVTTTFDNTDKGQSYTCTVEVVDGNSVAKIDSLK